MLKSMPSEFLRNKKQMRFFTSVDSEIDYRDLLAERATVVGDKFLEQDAPVAYSGVLVVDVPRSILAGSPSIDILSLMFENLGIVSGYRTRCTESGHKVV